MAPKKQAPKKQTHTMNDIDMDLLRYIVEQTQMKGFVYCSIDNISHLIENGLVEINRDSRNANGDVATRSTENGNKMINTKKTKVKEKVMTNTVANNSSTSYTIGIFDRSHVVERENRRRGRTSKYNLDALDAGNFIFIPVTEAHPTQVLLAKSLAGTVSAANKKFSRPTGEMKTVVRKIRNSDEKVEKQVPVTVQDREFKMYHYRHNDSDGIAIVRMV